MNIKRKLLLAFAVSLVLLQAVLPFLHAHTGFSSKSGFHIHFSGVISSDHSAEVTLQAVHESDSQEVAITNLKDRESEHLPLPLTHWLYVIVAVFFFAVIYLSPVYWRRGWSFSPPVKKFSSPNFYLPALAPPQTNL